MYIRVRGNDFTQNVAKEIAAITDRCLVERNGISYDGLNGVLVVPIQRFPIEQRPKRFRLTTRYPRDMRTGVRSVITVRQVNACKIEERVSATALPQVTMIFGLAIKADRVIACSAEESRGAAAYSVEARINSLDIEIRDEEETCR